MALQDQWIPSVHLAVMRQLEAFSPDVVHTHEPQGLSAAPFSAIARARLPHVHTVHDLNLLCVRVTMTKERLPLLEVVPRMSPAANRTGYHSSNDSCGA